MTTEIEWGYNCLTSGIHHGRPEAIWNITLMQTTLIFTHEQIQELVVDRIYNDAMQFVENGKSQHNITTPEWAEKVKELAEPMVLDVYQRKIGELSEYYRSPEFKRTLDEAIERNKEDKLNAHFAPLHSHDSINMLCRIVGTSCSREAAVLMGSE